MYIDKGKDIFDKRFLGILNPASWWTGKYKRKFIDDLCDKMFNKKMGELEKIFICTAVNMKDDQYTHFFKSYKEKYKDYTVSSLVKRTFSAPIYFGYYKDNDGLWADGGVGVHNCTLLEAYIETIRKEKGLDYYILSCGTGNTMLKYDGRFIFSQIKDFTPIARTQAIMSQISIGKELGIKFDRVDIVIEDKYDEMDKVKYIDKYIEYGKELVSLKADIITKKIKSLLLP